MLLEIETPAPISLELKGLDRFTTLAAISKTLIAYGGSWDSPDIMSRALVDAVASASSSGSSDDSKIIARWFEDGTGSLQLTHLETQSSPIRIWHTPREFVASLWVFDKLS